MSTTILAFSGSSRTHSINTKLLQHAVAGARQAGASVTIVGLADYEMPIYDGDLEEREGLPAGARAFQRAVAQHDALLIASPEHNGGYTALLKNALDWLSRPLPEGGSGMDLLAGKAAAVVSASPGKLGGVRSQTGLRIVLEKLGMVVIPQSIALGQAAPAAR
jgi:NAD(P)H-dependent FMN reductase